MIAADGFGTTRVALDTAVWFSVADAPAGAEEVRCVR
jgi:hypothetical protein